jgi:hypothetical protein
MSTGGWDSVLASLSGRAQLHDEWLNGLACNPAATGSVLWRIITVSERLNHPAFWLEWHQLTDEASAALARHPDRKVRLQLAQNPSLSLDALAVLGKDPDRLVRMLAAESAGQADRAPRPGLAPGPQPPGPPLARDEARALVASPDRLVRARAAWDERVPQDIALELADDPDDQVRLYLSMRKDLSEQQRAAISFAVPPATTTFPAGSPL